MQEKEGYNPINTKVNIILKQAKIEAMPEKLNTYVDGIITYLQVTDDEQQWTKEALEATKRFLKMGYIQGFKEGIK